MLDAQKRQLPSKQRRGVTLLELLVVVTLMGTLSTVVVTRYGRDIFGNIDARSEAHRLLIDLQRAKTLAIRNGTSVSVSFLAASTGRLTGYQVTEGLLSKPISVGELTSFSPDIQVSTNTPVVVFTFEGHAETASLIEVKGPDKSWTLNIVPLSGSVRISEI